MSADAVVALSNRLARLGVEADDVVAALDRENLHAGHALLLAAPHRHLEAVSERIEARLWDLDEHGKSWPAIVDHEARRAA